jgi:hypothetical protein
VVAGRFAGASAAAGLAGAPAGEGFAVVLPGARCAGRFPAARAAVIFAVELAVRFADALPVAARLAPWPRPGRGD